jgi:hypothetical protein
MSKAPSKSKTLEIKPITMSRARVHLLGTSPLIMHRFSSKSWRELLLPSPEKNKAEKAESLKHDPLTEYRECCYRNRDPNEPTAVHFPSGAFSKAVAAAALDVPGATKSQMLRLVSISTTQVNIYGVPMLGMDMVRNSDMARTPDVRTRAFFPEWCCAVDVEYVSTLINQTQIFNLIGAAGVIVGLGDYRPQKGGQFGKFMAVAPDDPTLLRVMKQGRAIQEAALLNPSFFNEDSAELYGWFVDEVARREKVLPSSSQDGMPLDQPGSLAEANTKRRRNGKGAQETA